MPLYVVDPGSFETRWCYEKSAVVCLLSDAASEGEIPDAVRDSCDRFLFDGSASVADPRIPEGSDAAVVWMAGDRLMEGSAPLLRHEVSLPGRRTFVPVHLPGAPEMDLVGLQPRFWKAGREGDIVKSAFRISGAAAPSPAALELLEKSNEHWAMLYQGLLAAQEDRAAGIERLSKMWRERSMMAPTYAALLLRNLVVLSFRQDKLEKVERLLNAGMDCYPRCADLACLAAWIALESGDLRKASRYAQQARANPDFKFVGAGGEASYRALWLLGLTAELAGKQARAVYCYLAGVNNRPAFPPSVYGLLRQRVPRDTAQKACSYLLVQLAHREPQYCEPVFQFLLLHGQIEALHQLAKSSRISDELRQKFQNSIDEQVIVSSARPCPANAHHGLRLSGPFYVHSSLARINREIVATLVASGEFEVSGEPSDYGDTLGMHLPHFDAVSQALKQRLSRLDLTIRQQWPPDLSAPACGKLVVLFPWEFGAVPRRWVEQIEKNVDELCLPSQFTREVFVRAGVQPARIQVIPYGIDTEVFKPEGASWRPESCRRFVFLFVGGAIPRKGADVLWNAYQKAFSIADDVTLVIKNIGAATFYSGQSVVDQIRVAIRKPRSPHVVILEEEIDDVRLAALYRGSDILVLPYRGEGFGFPLAEALACGKPVITTERGPAREFCPPEATYFIPAQVVEGYNPQDTFGPLTSANTIFEPDVNELARVMRSVVERPDEIARQGMQAADKVRKELTWARITQMYIERIHHLLGIRE